LSQNEMIFSRFKLDEPNDVTDCLIRMLSMKFVIADNSLLGIAQVNPYFHRLPISTLWVVAIAIVCCGGCSLLQKSGGNKGLDATMALQGSESADAFQRMRQAKSQNAIVLQVEGDSEPIRVLPLPPDGRPVFVSDLLRQTGVQEKMNRMLVTVHRSSPVDYEGAKMDVRFEEDGDAIRPETDYALQSGDRIRIRKDSRTAFGNMMEQILPANASRAVIGR